MLDKNFDLVWCHVVMVSLEKQDQPRYIPLPDASFQLGFLMGSSTEALPDFPLIEDSTERLRDNKTRIIRRSCAAISEE